MNDLQTEAGTLPGTDPSTWTRPRALWKRLLFEGDPSGGTPVQFGLRSVLLLQAVAAAALSLLVMLEIFGVLILFVGTVLVMFLRVSPDTARARRVFADLLAGALMPMICVFFDPGILRNDLGVVAIAAILIQIAMLLAWQLVPRGSTSVSAFFAGILSVGFVLAMVIGVCILPMTLLGMLFLVGFLGTMPFLTAIVYLRNTISAWRMSTTSHLWLTRLMFVVGVLAAVGLPIALHQAFESEMAHYLRSLPRHGGW